jgi:hypothetical protein
MSRLTVDLTDQQHQTLKALAALQRRTIKEYVLERLFPDDANGDQAWQDLKTLLGERINDGLTGRVSTKTVSEMLDEELAETRPA